MVVFDLTLFLGGPSSTEVIIGKIISMRLYFIIFVAGITLLLTFDTVWVLASFLTYNPLRVRKYSACNLPDDISRFFSLKNGANLLLRDGLLLSCFVIQHTLMARVNVQMILDKMGIGVLTRSIYVIASCVTLQHVDVCLWSIPSEGWIGNVMWYSMYALHVMSWFMVYGGCLLVDVGELIGIKQVMYEIRGFPDPLRNKSEDLLRYYKHMRHPSFVGFCIILLAIPQMSLDRLLLAMKLILYMLFAWRTDARDISYLRYQLADKEASNGDWRHHSYQKRRSD
ncbi:hypothetical protein J437_LFUL008640 [Ladona fulva]|uniref:Nuclear envelope membrane protein n=1 Tax=Ladona fulva TaxID=123851 RepID=A0A8K0P0J2_LADFU|nr:hypothetical protein J437_LFUL008640 [Ladona fulva]